MKVTVVVGPGCHDRWLLGSLVAAAVPYRVIRAWPRFAVGVGMPGGRGTATIAGGTWYDFVRWLVWAGWRRLPWAGRYETPRAPLDALFDLLARCYVDRSDLFIGWSQVCLRSMRRAKKLGAVTLLEHPMIHVDTWMRLAEEEYTRWGQGAKGYYSLFPRALVTRMRREYAEADFISVLSSFAQRTFLEAGVRQEKLAQIPLGVDAACFEPGLPHEGPFRVLYVGRLEMLKGVQYLLQAYSELRLPGSELWLVGPVLPEMGPILARFERPDVRSLGEVAQSQLAVYYRHADVLVFPTVNDAFGLVILEAMASGLPVIASEHSAGRDVIEDGVHGFVLPIRDVGALKERLQYLFDHRDAGRVMGSAGRQRVLERFTWDHYGQRLLNVYRHILGRDGPTPEGST